MRYLKFTYIDAVTGVPITAAPARNGPVMPAISGLGFGFALESRYPADAPALYGTCPDDADLNFPGVLAELTEAEYQATLQGELTARLSKARAASIAANNQAYNAATDQLTADYPQREKDTWPTQNAEADAWVADPSGAVTPWIDRAASERGLEREEYIRRTLIKARQFIVMSSFLTGRRQRYEDLIKAGENPELDFTLTPEVMAQLQQVAVTVSTTSATDMKAALA